MSEDTLYKRLSNELKPYYENSDCCTYIVELRKYKREAVKEIKQLKEQLQQKENIIKEVREYITSYESISTIQGLNNLEVLNDGLDYKTIKEMTNRYLKVHDKILEILDKEVN